MNSEFLNVAIEAALKAGEIIARGFGTVFAISSKEGKHNLVTEYDKAAEKCIMGVILGRFPNHQILAEESGFSKGKEEVTWIVDPLDGTVNFAHNIPVFSVSIAAAVEGKVVCGVVFQPLLHELFVAEAGKGAYLNGSKISVTSTNSLEKAFLATGFPYNVHENPMNCIESFAQLTRLGIPIRRLGSAALDLSYVAAGRFDGYWEVSLEPWDFAAGKLLIEEAGGKVTGYDGSKKEILAAGPILSSNGVLHPKLIKELSR